MSSDEKTRNDDDSPARSRFTDARKGDFDPDSDSQAKTDSHSTPSSPSFFDHPTEHVSGFEFEALEIFAPDNLPVDFGNYTLLKKIGEGGAGIVFLATPHSNQPFSGEIKHCALKMIRPEIVANRRAVQRFEKESRLHSEIDSPFVTRHLQFGEVRGLYFIASEFVEGVPLDNVINSDSELSVTTSLRIIADVLKALAAMHSVGVIHRDVKPANIIASFQQLSKTEKVDRFGEFVSAKLTDFGLARHIEQSESLAMTRQQTTLGTPLYMAPEQHYESRAVDERADIYSLGVTLYQMLAGQAPFESETHLELAEMHRVQRPLPLTISRAGTSEAVNSLVMKALEKDPNLRYRHAHEMLADVERILNDQPIQLRMYPETPDSFHPAVKRYDFHWTLDAEVKQLWPLVSDTDRLNKAIGLPLPNFHYQHSGDQLKIFGDAKFKGMNVSWREHPFQWICEREMSVLREFDKGPFEWVTSTVELHRIAGQKTRLLHRIQVKPRGWFGKLLTPFQFGFLTKRSLDKVYARIETIANDTSCGFACDVPFGARPKLSKSQSKLLKDRAAQLAHEIKNVQLAREFGEFVERVADPTAARIRPFPLSKQLACTNDQAMQVCFAGVKVRLLNLSWDVICPVCRIAADNLSSLENIESHAHCKVCNASFELDFSRSVEAIFSVHPEIRNIELKTYCIGGPYHAPHVLAQNRLLVNQQVDIGVTLKSGRYEITGPQLGQKDFVDVEDGAVANRVEFVIGTNSQAELPTVCPGEACLTVNNQSDLEVLVRLEESSKREDALTANIASQHPLFKKLFPSEVTQAEQLVGLSNVYLLAIRHTNADEQLDRLGDIQVRENWKQFQGLFPTQQNGCEFVDCTHESLIASFGQLEDLLKTLLNAVSMETTETGIPVDECCFTIQAGEVMTGMSAHQPSTFGKTVRKTKKALSECSIRELDLPSDVYELVRQSSQSGPELLEHFELASNTGADTAKLTLHKRI